MKRLLVPLLVGLLACAGAARGGPTFSVVQGAPQLPTSVLANGGDLVLAPDWTFPPAQPVQLSYDQLLGLWQNAGQAYGIPWNVLAAINKIESNFGRNMGPSSAGAIGWMQFMPSTWMRWGTDADGNGVADPWNPVDAVYSAARYLAASGGTTDIRRAVFSYNHADWYVNEVLQLAQLYGTSTGAAADAFQNLPAAQRPVFALDRLQAKLDDARAAVSSASDAYRTALDNAQAFAGRAEGLAAEANAEPLLSDRLGRQKIAGQAGAVATAAQAEADRLKQRLAAAEAKLAQLQDEARGASFNEPARQILSGAPVDGSGSYVFPVGGGPSVVSVSHYHHDYPAADIVAPEGSPLYALSDGTVLYAWTWDQRCGTGFTMKTTDGQTWTYCHLSYLDPLVSQGAELKAGDPVGLVGETGDATGPHLHLQLQPASSYPQDQAWFQGFAGTAFQWLDAGAAKPGGSQPLVFHIVRPLD
ncbi:MAG: lytic murein transglycosylase [Verrucomicrobiota bacterium]